MLSQALMPAVIGASIDALIGRDTTSFSRDCAIVLGLGLITAVSGILRHRCVVSNFLDAAYRSVQLVTEHVARLGETMTRLVSTGEIVSIAAADVEQIGDAIDISGRGSGAIAAMIAVAAILLSRSVALGLIVLIGAPVMTALVGLLLRPLHHRQQAYREQQGELAARAADIVSGLRVLRGIGGEAVFSGRYRAESQRLRGTGVHVAGAESYLSGAEVLVPGAFVTLATWLAAHYALHRSITAGDLVTFYAYAAFLVLPMATITEAADYIVRGYVAAGRVTRILGLQPDVASPAANVPRRCRRRRRACTTRCRASPRIRASSWGSPRTAPTRRRRWPTGSAGTACPPGPAPSWAACRWPELPVDAVRSRILVAATGAHLFGGQLARTIADAAPAGADDAAVMAALEVAAARDVLESLPGGIHGELPARGSSLSGGQAQRVLLARALLADPEILVLVEPTSAVDAHTEARIARGLRAHRAGRTTIVLTTSPLLLDEADRVVHLSGGRMAAQGSHHELLATSAAYADVVTRGEDA